MRAIQYDCSRDDWPGKQWHHNVHVDPSARFSSIRAVSISIFLLKVKRNPSLLLAFNYYFLRYNIVCKYRPSTILRSQSLHTQQRLNKCEMPFIKHTPHTSRKMNNISRNNKSIYYTMMMKKRNHGFNHHRRSIFYVHRLRPIEPLAFYAPKKLTGLFVCYLIYNQQCRISTGGFKSGGAIAQTHSPEVGVFFYGPAIIYGHVAR